MNDSTTAHSRMMQNLQNLSQKIKQYNVLVGFDGFVDEIVRVVATRHSPSAFTPVSTITEFAERLQRAAGVGTNMELAVQQLKLGGNGPIYANALATLGASVTCIGALGQPEVHPVFHELAEKATLISIAPPAITQALEFDDGKIMLGKLEPLAGITYSALLEAVTADRLQQLWESSDLIGVNNWTMVPHMTELWQALLEHHCTENIAARRPLLYFDLADPEKRTRDDIRACLRTITAFGRYFRVILGCNEKESREIAGVLGLATGGTSQEVTLERAEAMRENLDIEGVVIHPIAFAAAATRTDTAAVNGPYEPRPRISTGAGDHFNAGVSLALAAGMELETALLVGVATSGYYVRHAASPTLPDLVAFLKKWKGGTTLQ